MLTRFTFGRALRHAVTVTCSRTVDNLIPRPHKVLSTIAQGTKASSALLFISRGFRVTAPTECTVTDVCYSSSKKTVTTINMDLGESANKEHDPQKGQVIDNDHAVTDNEVTTLGDQSNHSVNEHDSTDKTLEQTDNQYQESNSAPPENEILVRDEESLPRNEQRNVNEEKKQDSSYEVDGKTSDSKDISYTHTSDDNSAAAAQNGSGNNLTDSLHETATTAENESKLENNGSNSDLGDGSQSHPERAYDPQTNPDPEQTFREKTNSNNDPASQTMPHNTGNNSEAPLPVEPAPIGEDTSVLTPNSDAGADDKSNSTPMSSSADTKTDTGRNSGIRSLFTIGDTSSSDSTEIVRSGDVVLVTGGSGFLGQHIIRLLQTRAPHVSDIWVLDIQPFEQRLEYQATKRVGTLVGDVADARFVTSALKGVDSVIHVAGLASWGTFPDLEGMEKANVMGTLNVFNSCIKNNVKRLIYCSTVDVAVGNKSIRGGHEKNTPVPDKFLFPGYPDTKYHGERIILGSQRQKNADGSQLQTMILRANVSYGELDDAYVTSALRQAKRSRGILYQIGDGKAMFQQAYVGNTAWAFICADVAMRENQELSGEIFYIPDHTSVQNTFNFMRPYLEARGFKLSTGYLSYALSHSAVAAAEILAHVISPLKKISLPVQSCTIAYINTDLYFSGAKAKEILKFEPIFTPIQARALSMKYYQNIDLDNEHDK